MGSMPIVKKDIRQALQRCLGPAGDRLRFDEPMDRHTTLRIGGTADAYFEPADVTEIKRAARFCVEQDIPCTLLGNGSNVLVSDQGIRGLVMTIGSCFSGIEYQGTRVRVKAGTRLAVVSAAAAEVGLTGLEFASGIPGTIGGAIQMNAGAYDGCMQDVVVETEYLNEQLIRCHVQGAAHEFTYRHSLFSDRSLIILQTELQLAEGKAEHIKAKMTDLAQRRKASQPLEWPSAGSVFKRPEGFFAGKLISDCRMKGMSIGGAQVSEKHAGFIVNRNAATARDVFQLIHVIQKTVMDQTGIWLEPEIKFIGDFSS
jgi:UDP-N-acetylmuramate dehydrogenase